MAGLGRIRLETDASLGENVTIEGSLFDALVLWRPRAGQAFTVSAPNGRLLRARLTELGAQSARLLVFEDMGATELPLEMTLVQALPEKERMELVIEKAAELGATSVIPCRSARSITLEQRDSPQKKSHKWQDVALKAARQSRGAFITEVLPYRALDAALGAASNAVVKIALWERPGITGIKDALSNARATGASSVAVLSGPEGGFSAEEMEEAVEAGFVPVSLGERVLRAETAAIAALAMVRYELGA